MADLALRVFHNIRATLPPMILLAGLTTAAVTGGPQAAADDGMDAYQAGLAAYDGGRYADAVRQWRTAARAGLAPAMTALAGLYHLGEGVGADMALALGWYRRAAEAGDVTAQLNLGELLADGSGVARDPMAAHHWLSLAARQGNAWAARRLARLEGTMTASQRKAARKIAENQAPVN